MRQHIIDLLGQVLHNNIGNRLTAELATGIATTLNHALLTHEQNEAPAPPAPESAP